MRPGPYPPKWFFFLGKKFLLAQGVQLFVAVPTVPRGTLAGAYRRTYLHLHARYRGWVGGVRAVLDVLSQLLGKTKKNHLGGYAPGRMICVMDGVLKTHAPSLHGCVPWVAGRNRRFQNIFFGYDIRALLLVLVISELIRPYILVYGCLPSRIMLHVSTRACSWSLGTHAWEHGHHA